MSRPASDFQVNIADSSLRRQIEEQLRRMIINGHFAPGAHLSDRVLCEIFGVSRAVVREALRQLEAEGLVETIRHKGSFVKIFSVEEVEQLYSVRGVLEALAAKDFARHATDEQIEQLSAVLDQIAANESPRPDLLLDLKRQFYSVLLAVNANAYVRTMLGQIYNRIMQLRGISLSDTKRLPDTIAELSRLVDAIRRRAEEAAWAASLEHVNNAGRVAIQVLKQRSAESDAVKGTSAESVKPDVHTASADCGISPAPAQVRNRRNASLKKDWPNQARTRRS